MIGGYLDVAQHPETFDEGKDATGLVSLLGGGNDVPVALPA